MRRRGSVGGGAPLAHGGSLVIITAARPNSVRGWLRYVTKRQRSPCACEEHQGHTDSCTRNHPIKMRT